MKKNIEILCGTIAAVALFSIMALTFFDVIGRKLFDNSIPGSFEITELLMVSVIFAALPLVSMRSEHVTFDSLDSILSPSLLRLQSIVVNIVCIGGFIGIGWLMFKMGLKFHENGDKSSQLGIPQAPFIFSMATFLWLSALVHVGLLLRSNSDSDTSDQETSAL
jgi:TRAP-type transport system small permease protein